MKKGVKDTEQWDKEYLTWWLNKWREGTRFPKILKRKYSFLINWPFYCFHSVPEDDADKIKFDKVLKQKYSNIEMLGKILIQQERENLTISKQQAKLFKKIGIEKSSSKKGESKYELESLLNESSSGDE